VLLLPYHHPVVLAEQRATIDVLSQGRPECDEQVVSAVIP
jgi:alkanesulfonate monooxygenase SsuD/methylene tetrahydromethanopterin reductase-like flavin-dependent oxidoreductase (luciferase family)